MIQIEILPYNCEGDPAADGCSAWGEVISNDSGNYPELEWSWNYDKHKLIAVEAKGWEFVIFRWTHVTERSYAAPLESEYSADANRTSGKRKEFVPESNAYKGLRVGNEVSSDLWWNEQVIKCRAYFKRKNGFGYILYGAQGTILHGAAGTILYDD